MDSLIKLIGVSTLVCVSIYAFRSYGLHREQEGYIKGCMVTYEAMEKAKEEKKTE